MRFLLTVGATLALALSTVVLVPPSRAAAAGTYWFHGQPSDQGDKANGVASATFVLSPEPTSTVTGGSEIPAESRIG